MTPSPNIATTGTWKAINNVGFAAVVAIFAVGGMLWQNKALVDSAIMTDQQNTAAVVRMAGCAEKTTAILDQSQKDHAQQAEFLRRAQEHHEAIARSLERFNPGAFAAPAAIPTPSRTGEGG